MEDSRKYKFRPRCFQPHHRRREQSGISRRNREVWVPKANPNSFSLFSEESRYYQVNPKHRSHPRHTSHHGHRRLTGEQSRTSWTSQRNREVWVPRANPNSFSLFSEESGYYQVNKRIHPRHRSHHSHRPRNTRTNTRQHSCGSKSVNPFTDVPLDIISLILSKCPIKSIMRFRCVAKSFYGITRNPSFIKLHLSASLEKPSNYILTENGSGLSGCIHPVDTLYFVEERKEKWNTTEIPVSDVVRGPKLQIVGSSNGLLCLSTEDPLRQPVLVYNPITKECVTLPTIFDPNSNDVVENSRPWWHPGFEGSISFGFDVIYEKYKVVVIYLSNNQDAKGMAVHIFTLGETTWRKAHLPCKYEFVEYLRNGKKSVFSNGSFYWIIKKEDDSVGKKKILAMDISEEKFDEIDFINPPGEHAQDEDEIFYLLNFVQSLALIVYDPYSADMQIWILMDSARGIWNLHSTHNMLSFLKHKRERSDELYHCRIEGMVGDDSLLLDYFDDHLSDFYNLFSWEGGHYLVRYTPAERKFQVDFVSKKKIPRDFDVVSFVPSFVSFAWVNKNH